MVPARSAPLLPSHRRTRVLRCVALVCLLLSAVAARAEGLVLLAPEGRVAPEAFLVALAQRGRDGALEAPAGASLRARGAEVHPGPAAPPLATYRVVPERGAGEVELEAAAGGERLTRRLALGPPAARVELALQPAAPVKGRDTEAVLTVRLLRPDGSADGASSPPVLRASVGRVEALREEGPGLYRARYVLPATRYPEVAVLVALAPWPHPLAVHGAVGALRVPLATAIELPGTSEPGARMSLRIGGVEYGPAPVGGDGRFRVPVVVPPGERFAEGTAVDRAGNRRRARLDLRLPPVDPLACIVNPPQLPADGASQARVLCAVSDAQGQPLEAEGVRLEAQRGLLEGPSRAADGLLEWRYTAPRGGQGPDGLLARVRHRGVDGREELTVEPLPAPAATVRLEPREPLVHLGGRAWLDVEVRDARGGPQPSARVQLSPSLGTVGEVALAADGTARVAWSLPAEAAEVEAEVTARAWGPVGTEPAQLRAWSEAGALRVAAVDLAGLPVPGQPLRVAGRDVVTGPDGSAEVALPAPGPVTLVHRRWPDLRHTVSVLDGKGRLFPASPPPVASARARVVLGPSLPVNVRLQVEGRQVTCWAEDAAGALLAERELRVHVSSGEAPVPQRDATGRLHFTLRTPGAAVVSVADVASGVTAVARVPP